MHGEMIAAKTFHRHCCWRRRLNLLLGTEEWYEEFYRSESTPTLFGGAAERVVKASTETIGRYFNNRLKSIFAAVADDRRSKPDWSCPLKIRLASCATQAVEETAWA